MATKPVPLRIPEELVELLDVHTREQRTDRATVLRQWLWQSAEKATVVLVSEGKLSIGRACELLDRSHQDIYQIAQENRIELGASEEQRAESLMNLEALKPKDSSRG
ncbi:MAG: hypothetical protein O3A93_03625 [Chloroflexi bacterium]|nr:hypothetical protein [Chloroflexota bacterium]MDA1270337.1 hypothetical protein [Chloroflexota bacterium]